MKITPAEFIYKRTQSRSKRLRHPYNRSVKESNAFPSHFTLVLYDEDNKLVEKIDIDLNDTTYSYKEKQIGDYFNLIANKVKSNIKDNTWSSHHIANNDSGKIKNRTISDVLYP